jgi:hypothetical protein
MSPCSRTSASGIALPALPQSPSRMVTATVASVHNELHLALHMCAEKVSRSRLAIQYDMEVVTEALDRPRS